MPGEGGGVCSSPCAWGGGEYVLLLVPGEEGGVCSSPCVWGGGGGGGMFFPLCLGYASLCYKESSYFITFTLPPDIL